MTRDDFSQTTKDLLAKRAGYRCSFPECGAPAYGPSDEGSDRATNVGTAAHIAAASSGRGARRYLGSMTPDERSSIDNGIWMCRTHGKLIDDDEARYTIATLKKWKEITEYVARIMVEKNCEYWEAIERAKFVELAPEAIAIEGIGKVNEIVGSFINESCLSIAWGKITAYRIRDFVIEHIRNAFQHGRATSIQISSLDNKIQVIDDGAYFQPKSLLERDLLSGGILAVKELHKEQGSQIIFTSQYMNDRNNLIIGKIYNENDILLITPCSHRITFEEFRQGQIQLQVNESCSEVFVVLPNYLSPSDIGLLTTSLFNLEPFNKPITLITRHLSDLVSRLLRQHNPRINIIEI
jgi:hypothetical protein